MEVGDSEGRRAGRGGNGLGRLVLWMEKGV